MTRGGRRTSRVSAVEQDPLFERLWNGEATMEEWTATDHTLRARLLDQEAEIRGIARPRIIAHRNVLNRFAAHLIESASTASPASAAIQPRVQTSTRDARRQKRR